MARSVRLQKKLHTRHLMATAEEVVLDDNLVGKLWALNRGDRFELNSASFSSGSVQKYRLEYVITRGPVFGHWLYKEFDPGELVLFFTAKDFDGICHGWTLFDE
ncbi:hypothetical protein [Pseudomonas donghuensis]|uniref:hypothetical protein n=1 Tax=Pseudomonas donghuensis TaxID=1163398 RepID=UPI0020C55F0C|nr:hypothetical protein [Pseudomonas donghuensis]MCP6696344.1 hypothetical protein [Pseudomonas donghuensis]